jgi:hypothetical protein
MVAGRMAPSSCSSFLPLALSEWRKSWAPSWTRHRHHQRHHHRPSVLAPLLLQVNLQVRNTRRYLTRQERIELWRRVSKIKGPRSFNGYWYGQSKCNSKWKSIHPWKAEHEENRLGNHTFESSTTNIRGSISEEKCLLMGYNFTQ